MAIDRESLATGLGGKAWTALDTIVPLGISGAAGPGAPGWSGIGLAERRRQGAARVAKWRGASDRPLVLRLALPAGPGADLLFDSLVRDMATIGVTLQRGAEAAPADLRLVDLVARYWRSEWYLHQLSCPALKGPCSPAADKLLAQARDLPEGQDRAVLLGRAEGELTSEYVYLPLGSPVRWSLVRGRDRGFTPNRWAIHPLMPMAMRPK